MFLPTLLHEVSESPVSSTVCADVKFLLDVVLLGIDIVIVLGVFRIVVLGVFEIAVLAIVIVLGIIFGSAIVVLRDKTSDKLGKSEPKIPILFLHSTSLYKNRRT